MKSSGAVLVAPKCSAYSGAALFRVNTVSGNSTKTPRLYVQPSNEVFSFRDFLSFFRSFFRV